MVFVRGKKGLVFMNTSKLLRIRQIISDVFDICVSDITIQTKLRDDLNADDFDIESIFEALEKHYNIIYPISLSEIITISDILDCIELEL